MHKWTEGENIAVLVLTKRYGKAGWEEDSLAQILILNHGITKGSIQMAIQNFLHLMGEPGGLTNSSQRQRKSFTDYGQLSLEELQKKAESALSTSEKARMPHDEMYGCEEKRPFIENSRKVLRWKVVEVSSLDSGGASYIRCMHCHGKVRVHKQQVSHGPRDHVEHLFRGDSIGCKGGFHFQGTHKMSSDPVE